MIKSILENFYTIFWIISVLFIFSSFFFYRKNYSKIFNSWILFIITFLYTIYWIPQGFDITDEGYMLSKSWFMTHGMWSYNIDKIWGSTLLNKLRLSVLGTPSLIWVRFGYSIVVALMAVFSFKILKFRFDKIEAFISVFALSLISYSGRLQIINYHNISTLILLISIYFFVLAFVKKNNKILIISGFLILLATVSKITLGLFLAYPFFYFLIINVLEKNKFSEFIIKNIYVYAGVFIALIFSILILIYTKSLDDFYIHLFRTAKKNANSNSTHSFSYLWDLYKNDLWLIFSKSFYVSIWLIISALIIKKVKLKIFKILILVLFAWFGLYFTIEIYEYEKWKYMIYAIGVASLLLYLIFSDNYKNDFSILFFSIILFFISFFGSNNGIRILLASGAGIFSISAFILLLKSVKLKFNNIEYNFHISILSILIFIFLLINENKPKDIYRDYPREKITTYFQSRPLIGIKSEKSKVEVVDSLYHFLKSNVSKDNSIMCVTTIQMLYFILDKKYHTYDLWKQPETEFKNINKKKDIDYFIFPLKNPRIHHWIKKHDKPLAKNDSINYKFYKNIVIEKKYLKVYTNSMFEVFKKAD